MRGTRSSPFSSGITTSVMTRSPSPSCDPPPQRRGGARCCGHCGPGGPAPGAARCGSPGRRRRPGWWLAPLMERRRDICNCNGSITRNIVRPGSLSNSITPPWSLMILATKARPRPVPVGLVVTKASNRWARISSDMPAAVVPHRDHQRQVDLGLLAGHGQAHAVAVGGGQLDLALAVARHLAGVLHQVQEHLDQLVAVAMHVGQRGVVGLDEAHALAEAVLRRCAARGPAPGGC